MVTGYTAVRLEPVVATVPFVEDQNGVYRSKKYRNRNGFGKNQNLYIYLLIHSKAMHPASDSDKHHS